MLNEILTKCPVCDGQGFFVTAPENLGGWLDCPECHGKGWLTEQEVEDNKAKWLNSGFGKLVEKHKKSDLQDYLTITY